MGTDSILHPRPGDAGVPSMPSLVCFSHLRWSFVWQRPQHLLSRFSRTMRVFVVEEPAFVAADDAGRLRVDRRDGITIVTPLLPETGRQQWGFNAETNPAVGALLSPFFREHGLLGDQAQTVAWYYTPMALGAEPRRFDPSVVVYDVMDELANFRGAPAELREREAAMFARADVVFTGGPSLYDARKGRHPDLHCFPSGVDVRHFAQAADRHAHTTELSTLRQPVIGFYGVIDERLDIKLLEELADLRPAWTFAMIGPIVKIAPEDLPQRENILYPGKREYDDLPAYLSGFDAAILPFAINEATRFISPTKTLEYLAGGKPVVSTPIKDVVDLYGSVVEVAADAPAFVAAIERLWREPAAERAERTMLTQQLLAHHSWESIARRMRSRIEEIAARRAGVRQESGRIVTVRSPYAETMPAMASSAASALGD